MSESKLLKELEEQIRIDREVIELAPRKGIKSIRALLKNIEEMQEVYGEIHKNVLKEIEDRYLEITDVTKNDKIEVLKKEIEKIDELITITDDQEPYEKMELGKLIYNINGYYKKDLNTVNKDIIECIKKFKSVGINLTDKDFNISEYVNEYMAVLLGELNKENIDFGKMKETFEKIYWRCSELITHINVNIRYIYDKNVNNIRKFYKNEQEKILATLNIGADKLEERRNELIRNLEELENTDDRLILDKFLTNTLIIGDYKQETYDNVYFKLVSKLENQLKPEEKETLDENIKKLNQNLVEYTKFLEYKFINDEILKLKGTQPKDTDKKKKKEEYEEIQEQIKKTTAQIFKLNTSIEKELKSNFLKKKINGKKIDTETLERNNKILEVKDLYMRLDNSLLKSRITQNIDETSKLSDVLKFAGYYYDFLARIIIKKNPEILDNEIAEMIENIMDFIRHTDFTVINNINISEKKEISVVIKDRYKLFGMTLTKEDFQEANLEALIADTQIINNRNYIEKSNLSIPKIRYAFDANVILKN